MLTRDTQGSQVQYKGPGELVTINVLTGSMLKGCVYFSRAQIFQLLLSSSPQGRESRQLDSSSVALFPRQMGWNNRGAKLLKISKRIMEAVDHKKPKLEYIQRFVRCIFHSFQ